MIKRITSIILSCLLVLSSVGTISFASSSGTVEVVTTVELSDGNFTRKGSTAAAQDQVQTNSQYVIDPNNANNFRVAFFKFDLSSYSIDEISSCDSATLVLKDIQGDTLPLNSTYNFTVDVLAEDKNFWTGSTITYNIANEGGLYTGGTTLATVEGSMGDTGDILNVTLDKTVLVSALEASTSKIITIRIKANSSVWAISGGVGGTNSPKLKFTTQVSIAEQMQSIYDSLDFSDISSDIESSVVNNLDFSSTQSLPYGIVVDWASTDDAVVDSSGNVNRPITNFGGADTPITLTATVSCPGYPDITPLQKVFDIIVLARTLTEAELVAEEVSAFGFDSIKGSNVSADSVTDNLDYTYQGLFQGTSITYSSSPPGYISADGTVQRPFIGLPPVDVTITAHITNGSFEDDATLDITILAQEATEDLMDTKEIYATHTENISLNNRDTPGARQEPVIAASGHVRFALLRFDLSTLNDEEIANLDSAIFRIYTTSEVAMDNANFTVGIVPDSYEANLESSIGALTYNMLSSYGILNNGVVPVIYNSGNVMQSGENYETTNLVDAIEENLDGSSNKVVWFLINSTRGVMVLGSPTNSNPMYRPTIKAKHVKTLALRDLEAVEIEQVATSDISLPSHGLGGTPIDWATSDPLVVASDGTITRYNIGENYDLEDTTATLTATTSNLWSTYTRDFDIRVKMGGVIDATAGATIDLVQTDTSSEELVLGGSNEAKAAIMFNLSASDKSEIAAGRKTVIKIYGDPSFATLPIKLYTINEARLSSLDSLSSLTSESLSEIIAHHSTLIGTSSLDEGGYVTFDVSDYVRSISGNKAVFVITSQETIFLVSPETSQVIKLPKLIVSDIAFTNAYGAAKAAEQIKFSDLTNDPQNALRFDLNLPFTGIYASTVSWSVNPPGAIDTLTGALNRTADDRSATLTATVTVGDQSAQKAFDVIIKKAETDSAYLDHVLSGISLPYKHLTSSITLPGQELLDLGFADSVVWESSEDYEASISGFDLTLTRPSSADLAVNLKVTVGFNGTYAEKDIAVWVLRSADSNILRGRQVVSGDSSATHAVDENIQTYWSASRKTVIFTLNSRRIISSLTLIPYRTSIEGIKISVSDDNVTYTEVYNGGSFAAEELGYITFSPVVLGRYIKLELPQSSSGIRFLGAYTTSDEASNDIFSTLTLPANASANFSLPQTLAGVPITWTSSSREIVVSGFNALVTRGQYGANVTLTASVEIGGETLTKNYVVYVPARQTQSGTTTSLGGSTITAPAVTPTPQAPASPLFTDLDKAPWAKDYIERLAADGIINGYGDGTFAPNDKITREEMSKLLVLTFDIASGDNTLTFADVDPAAWYAQYVNSLASSGHTSGIGDGKFGVGSFITRQDAFTLLASVLGLTSVQQSESTGFGDGALIAPYAKDAIASLKALGIIGGDDFGNINPTAGITRAEVAKIICLSLK